MTIRTMALSITLDIIMTLSLTSLSQSMLIRTTISIMTIQILMQIVTLSFGFLTIVLSAIKMPVVAPFGLKFFLRMILNSSVD
jgi:hypothetical protein